MTAAGESNGADGVSVALRRRVRLKRIALRAGGVLAAASALVAVLAYAIPDKSAEFASGLAQAEARYLEVEEAIAVEHEARFVAYQQRGEKMPEAEFAALVRDAVRRGNLEAEVSALVDFLDRVVDCDERLWCRVSNVSVYDRLVYRTWFTLRPYLLERRPSEVRGFAVPLEKRAIELMPTLHGS